MASAELGFAVGFALKGDHLLANLGVGGKIARPDAVAKHRRGLSLGHIQIVRAGQIEPARGRFLRRRESASRTGAARPRWRFAAAAGPMPPERDTGCGTCHA